MLKPLFWVCPVRREKHVVFCQRSSSESRKILFPPLTVHASSDYIEAGTWQVDRPTLDRDLIVSNNIKTYTTQTTRNEPFFSVRTFLFLLVTHIFSGKISLFNQKKKEGPNPGLERNGQHVCHSQIPVRELAQSNKNSITS